jgi:hypothetical protein
MHILLLLFFILLLVANVNVDHLEPLLHQMVQALQGLGAVVADAVLLQVLDLHHAAHAAHVRLSLDAQKSHVNVPTITRENCSTPVGS